MRRMRSLLSLSRRELRSDPWSMLGPGIVVATTAVFLHPCMTFLSMAIGSQGEAWRAAHPDYAVADDVVFACMVMSFTVVPAIVVLGGLGAGTVGNMAGRIVQWRLAGASPRQSGGVVIGMLSASALAAGALGTAASIPLLPATVGMILEAAGLSGIDVPVDPAAMGATLGAVFFTGALGAVRPAVAASRVLPGPTLREAVPEPGGHRRTRAALALALAAGAVSTGSSAFAAKPGAAIDSAFNAILGSGVLAVGAVAAGAPWVFPRVNALLGRAVPATASPAWFAACRQSSAYPKRTTRAALPFFAGAGVAGLFTGMIGTWQRAIAAQHRRHGDLPDSAGGDRARRDGVPDAAVAPPADRGLRLAARGRGEPEDRAGRRGGRGGAHLRHRVPALDGLHPPRLDDDGPRPVGHGTAR